MAKQHKPRLCRICKRRQPWRYKNCPPGVCKRCYHRYIWSDRPAARKARQESTTPAEASEWAEDGVNEFETSDFGENL